MYCLKKLTVAFSLATIIAIAALTASASVIAADSNLEGSTQVIEKILYIFQPKNAATELCRSAAESAGLAIDSLNFSDRAELAKNGNLDVWADDMIGRTSDNPTRFVYEVSTEPKDRQGQNIYLIVVSKDCLVDSVHTKYIE